MKRLLYTVLILMASASLFSCSSEPSSTPNDDANYPRILGRWPEMKDGVMGVFGAQSGVDLNIKVMFTPSDLCVGVWYLDGVEYCRGTEFNYHSGQPVRHHLKLVVKTPTEETSREAYIEVK